jgi:shikimate kinase
VTTGLPGQRDPAPGRDELLTRPIALIGFMGVGKSAVGRELSRLLDRRYVDSDATIVERTGQTIPELFAEGEQVFRDAEYAVLTDLVETPRSVISLGGGAFAQPRCAELLLERALVVNLYVPWTLMIGLLDDLAVKRPLLQGKQPWEVQELYLSRAAAYRRAHLRLRVPRRRAAHTAASLAMLLGGPLSWDDIPEAGA